MSDILDRTRYVQSIAVNCWRRNRILLGIHGFTIDDVKQEAWVRALQSNLRGEDVRGLRRDLSDWIRQVCFRGDHAKVIRPSFRGLIESDHPMIVDNVERQDLMRRLVKHAKGYGGRMNFLQEYLAGDTMKEIGNRRGLTEGRVSQIFKEWRSSVRSFLREGRE